LSDRGRRRPRGRVVHQDDVSAELIHTKPPLSPGDVSVRTLIDRSAGARSLVQQVLRIRGEVPVEPQRKSENVLYVVEGSAWFLMGEGAGDPLWPGTAALVPPGLECRLARTSATDLVVVSVLSAQPGTRSSTRDPRAYDGPRLVREEDQLAIAIGDDRSFRLLIDPRHGARHVTQFVGFIQRGRAPFHAHAHEEAIYVLKGTGVAHIEDRDHPIRPGSSIFLPPETRHCLENQGEEDLKVLGVFSPPGSPADKTETHG
jgi:quercetin dioxygenase-like cupin family protein